MSNLKAIKSICKSGLVALFALCAFGNVSFGFYNTYNHNITIQKQPSFSETLEKGMQRRHEQNLQNQQLLQQQDMQYQQQMFQMQQEQARFQQQEHLERLRNDPEYAQRVTLNKKWSVLNRVDGEYSDKAKVLNEKEKIIFDEKNELDEEMGALAKKAEPISLGIKTLVDKAKSILDNPKLLSQEKLELKELISKKESLDIKAKPLFDKVEALESKIKNIYNSFRESIAKPIDIINKSSAEMETYQHKIEYDNVAFQAWLKEYEKQVEVVPQILRKKELYVIELEKTFEEYVKSATEVEKFSKEFMENKSLVRKYERLIKKIEKRLAKLGA